MTREEKANEIAQRWMDVLLDGENFDKHDLYNICMQMAEWADQHPMKGLWDAEKVINFLKERATLENSSNINIHINGATYHSVNDFIHDLKKAMED